MTKQLSPRELEIMDLLAKGTGQKKIASALDVSPHTVAALTHRIRRKLGVRTTYQVVIEAYKRSIGAASY